MRLTSGICLPFFFFFLSQNVLFSLMSGLSYCTHALLHNPSVSKVYYIDHKIIKCTSSSVVYLITCIKCGMQYVGKTTSENMFIRVIVHPRAIRHADPKSAGVSHFADGNRSTWVWHSVIVTWWFLIVMVKMWISFYSNATPLSCPIFCDSTLLSLCTSLSHLAFSLMSMLGQQICIVLVCLWRFDLLVICFMRVQSSPR